MGREEHRGALANAQFVDVVPDVHASLGIEPDRRLVEEQDPRRVEQTPSDLEAALHATGVEAGLLTRPVGEPDHLEQRVHAPLDLRTVQPVQDGVEAQVLLTCEVVVQGHFLKDEPDVRTDLVTGAQDVVTGDPGEPVGGVQQRAQTEIVVVLPAPLGPRKPNSSPGSTENEMPSTAVKSPKRLTRPSTSTAPFAPFVATTTGQATGRLMDSCPSNPCTSRLAPAVRVSRPTCGSSTSHAPGNPRWDHPHGGVHRVVPGSRFAAGGRGSRPLPSDVGTCRCDPRANKRATD